MTRQAEVRATVVGVVTAALRDARCSTLLLRDDGSPEAALLARWLGENAPTTPLEREAEPAPDAAARGRLLLEPFTKTVAVLWPELATAPLLPLADLYSTQVKGFAGGCSVPAVAEPLIAAAGGVEAVDRFLVAHLDERRPIEEAMAALPAAAADELESRFRAGWWWRRRLGVVPKIGARTLGVDLR